MYFLHDVQEAGTCSEFDDCNAAHGFGTCGDDGRCQCSPGFRGLSCNEALECKWWDASASPAGWSSAGCTLLPANASDDGFLYCECDHLTDFSAVSFPTSPDDLLEAVTLKPNIFGADELGDFFTSFFSSPRMLFL